MLLIAQSGTGKDQHCSWGDKLCFLRQEHRGCCSYNLHATLHSAPHRWLSSLEVFTESPVGLRMVSKQTLFTLLLFQEKSSKANL